MKSVVCRAAVCPLFCLEAFISVPLPILNFPPSLFRLSARSNWPWRTAPPLPAPHADEQRVFASYREARNQYIPQLVVGSGLGKSWGFPLSLEGSAPSILNVNSQSTIFNPSIRDFVRAAKTDWSAATAQTKDQRNQVIQDTVLSYAELAKWETLVSSLTGRTCNGAENRATGRRTHQGRRRQSTDAEQGASQHSAAAIATRGGARGDRRDS